MSDPTPDLINSPPHYRANGFMECIDAIRGGLTPDEFRGYLKGQIYKYAWRERYKENSVRDIGKLIWYANELKVFLQLQEDNAAFDEK